MTPTASSCDLMVGYEALRAQAVGELAEVTPRGKAILVCAGLAAWMAALPPPEGSSMAMAASRGNQDGSRGRGDSEMVCVLAEMISFAEARS